MMKLREIVTLVLIVLPCWLFSAIVLVQPGDGEVVTTVEPFMRNFLDMKQGERREKFSDAEYRKQVFATRSAQPYLFKWQCTAGEAGEFKVVVAEDRDFNRLAPVLVIGEGDEERELNSAKIVNFEIGAEYFWRVECASADGGKSVSATGRFTTTPTPPRLLAIPGVENVRDLGGYCGLKGRKVRQGMIYRSAGLNAGSPDHKKMLKITDPEEINQYRIGKSDLTPESIEYITEVLGWRTDLELRSLAEIGPLKASPAGKTVKLIHSPSASYSGIFADKSSAEEAGPQAMADNFRVFCKRENYPIVFHCAAGSSRTGSLAFVLSGLLGVDENHLLQDLEITGSAAFVYEKRADALLKGIKAFGEADDPLYRRFELYLLDLGITADEIRIFREIMLK